MPAIAKPHIEILDGIRISIKYAVLITHHVTSSEVMWPLDSLWVVSYRWSALSAKYRHATYATRHNDEILDELSERNTCDEHTGQYTEC